MNTLTQLQNELALVHGAMAAVASEMGDIASEVFELNETASDLHAAVERESAALVNALADAEMGLPADVPAARQRLADARLLSQNGIESSQRLSVLSVLRQRKESEHVALHEKGLVIMADIREAEKGRLIEVANGLFNDCETALESLAQAEPKLLAVRSLLAEFGHPWHLGQLVQAQVQARFPTTPNQARASVLAELNA